MTKRILILSGVGIALLLLMWFVPPPDGLFRGTPNDTTIANLQTKYDQATEIKAKYQLENGALVRTIIKNPELDKYENEPKDEIRVEIGNRVDPELMGAKDVQFEPTIELTRWNEVSFKITPDISDVDLKDRKLSFDKEKIIFETPKVDYHLYELPISGELPEGGYEFEVILKEKPLTNKIEFQIETEGLDFLYQPKISELSLNDERLKGATDIQDSVAYDSDGKIVMELLSENVAGSYAVYHKTKGGINDINGKDYKVGKFGHIYRPKITDAEGNWAWESQVIDVEKEIITIIIPQDFLDNAIYPISSKGETFGYTTLPSYSSTEIQGDMIGYGASDNSPGFNGTVDKVTLAMANWGSGEKVRAGIYLSGGGNFVGGSTERSDGGDGWEDFIGFSSEDIYSASVYYIVGWGDSFTVILYDNEVTGIGKRDNFAYGNWPATSGDFFNINGYHGTYVTYTKEAAPAAAAKKVLSPIEY